MNAKATEAKARSKKELFMILKHDVKAYLPEKHDYVTTNFLKELVSGTKKRK